jgi:N,N'-diacetyllegionaminate synthase
MSVEIIAEIAQAHDGSLGIAHSYIDALAETGVNTIKFQMHIADAESSEFEQFRINFSYEDPTRFDYWKRMEFTLEQWAGLKKHCQDKGMQFLCSPFSIQAVQWLVKLEAERFKIASGEIENYLLLETVCKTGKPIVLSSGMSSYDELSQTINFIKEKRGEVAAVFQCTTAYPTPPEAYGLNVLTEIRQRFNCQTGLSDHSGEIYAPIAAVTLGAELIEAHAVFDKKMFGPDAFSSLDLKQFKQLVTGIRMIESSLQHPVDKNDTSKYRELKTMFGKSLAVNKNLKQGDEINRDDLETRKPGNMGIVAKDYAKVIGKKLLTDLKAGSFLNFKDLI